VAEGAKDYEAINHEIKFLRKVIQNEDKRKAEIVAMQKATFKKVDEMK